MELEQLKEIVNSKFNVDISVSSRKRHIVYPKKVFCKLARELSNDYTFYEIAKVIQLQHDNVIHHCNTFYAVKDYHKKVYNDIINEYNLNLELAYIKPIIVEKAEEPQEKKQNDILDEIYKMLSDLDDLKLIEFRDYRVKPYIALNK